MKDLITKEHRHLIWKDEVGHSFLLLKYAEVFRYSDEVLRFHSWSKKALSNLKKMCPVFNERATDDGLYIFDMDGVFFPQVIKAWAPRKRFAKNSKWLKDKEQRLAHKIISYKPDFSNVQKEEKI
jgi:hypothetical protein